MKRNQLQVFLISYPGSDLDVRPSKRQKTSFTTREIMQIPIHQNEKGFNNFQKKSNKPFKEGINDARNQWCRNDVPKKSYDNSLVQITLKGILINFTYASTTII